MKSKKSVRVINDTRDWRRKDLEGGPLGRELLAIKLFRLGDFIGRYSRRTFAEERSLTELELHVLIWACEAPPVSINDLAGLVHRGAGQVSRTVQKLVTAGMLNRTNVGGGPTVAITPTAQGLAFYGPLVEISRRMDAKVTRGLAEKDRPVVERAVDLLLRNTAEILSSPAPMKDPASGPRPARSRVRAK